MRRAWSKRGARRGLGRAGACALLACALIGCALGCHASSRPPAARAGRARATSPLDGTRWLWVDAECNDGPLDLGRIGFDRELAIAAAGPGVLVLTLESELATTGCFNSAQWEAAIGQGASVHFEPRDVVSLPPDTDCGAVERSPMEGSLRLSGDELELVTHGSPWCRGFDARFVYRRAEPRRLSARQVVTRYVGAFNRRDPDGLARLFVDSGSLIEPFSRTNDGNYRRHEGRDAIAAWYARAFGSTPWSAMRLTAIEDAGAGARIIADWQYMDARLAQPLHGRNVFVIAGGEIYESEVQLIDDPQPLRDSASSSHGPSTSQRDAPTVAP